MRICSRVALGAVLFLMGLWGSSAFAQSAELSGRVTDPNGLPVPKVRIEAVNVLTNVAVSAETNDAGLYYFSNLQPAIYRVLVEKQGFDLIVKPNVELHVEDHAAINFQLRVGSMATTVTVEGGAPLVNTESASVSTIVDRRLVENIPLNGRSFQTLIALTPGVVLTSVNASDQGQFSVNGQRADSNYFTVDGVSANFSISSGVSLSQDAAGSIPGFSAQGGTNSLVSVDAMQEFRIQTSSFAPEFGRTPGGQVSIQSRSGANQFHGTLFNYFRNDALDANDWFSNHNHLRKPAERQNDFGGVFGGPLFRDRTFFFVSYEGLRLRLPSSQTTAVPNQSTRQNAPSALQPPLNSFPVPNGADLGNGFAQFSASYSDPSSLDAFSVRLDHTVNASVSIFGRYNYAPSEVAARSATVLSEIQETKSRTDTFTLGSNQRITPRIDNEVRANFSYMRGELRLTLDNLGGATPLTDSVFPSEFTSATSKFQFTPIPGTILAFGRNAANAQRQLNIIDNLSLTAGTHAIKIGADYRWLAPIAGPNAYVQIITFSGINGPTGVLAGKTLVSAINAVQPTAFLIRNFSLYGQDTWKPMSRLTLTYGLRWDVNPPLRGKAADSDPFTVVGLSTPATMSLAPRGTPLYGTTYGNVAPRLGVAYQIGTEQGRELVVRGGVGTFYDLGIGQLGAVSGVFPFSSQKSLGSVPYPLTAQQAAPLPFATAPPVASLTVADPHLQLPRTYEWNAAIEQALGRSQSLSLTYVGSVGRKLLRADNLCFITALCGVSNPSFSSTVQVIRNTATSDYNALQVQFRRNVAHGLQALASYTWSHSLDIGSSDTIASAGTKADDSIIDRGNSDFDIRHTLNMAFTYDIPTPGAARGVRAMLANWSVESLLTARSAATVNVTASPIFVGGTFFTSRPNLVPGVPVFLTGSQYPGSIALNKTAFQTPTGGQQGNLTRNQLRMFGAWQENFGVTRRFKLRENLGLQFRAEFFNIFNHPNFGNPTIANLMTTSALFGQSTQTLASRLGSGGQAGGLSPLYQIGGPRSTQLALKLTF